ncbi:MAG: hypothetical protein ACLUKO_04080 [Enterocloster bolteae]
MTGFELGRMIYCKALPSPELVSSKKRQEGQEPVQLRAGIACGHQKGP